MTHAQGRLPSVESLVATLRAGGSLNASATADLEVLDRKSAPYSSTFPSEVVTCRLADGRFVQLFCKYAAGISLDSYGHRGGVAYEANVYRQVLQHCELTTLTYYGAGDDPANGKSVLVLENLQNAVRINKSRDPTAMVKAAEWIGKFHSVFSSEGLCRRHPFLKVYDEDYFLGWVRGALTIGEDWRHRYPWVASLSKSVPELVMRLLKHPTIVHGEYYPNNILYKEGKVFPVDWESAAISAGEIDLASLTDRWPEETVRQCEARYESLRYPDGAPADFQKTLSVAKLYSIVRWIGDRRNGDDQVSRRRQERRFEQLHALALQIGLL